MIETKKEVNRKTKGIEMKNTSKIHAYAEKQQVSLFYSFKKCIMPVFALHINEACSLTS